MTKKEALAEKFLKLKTEVSGMTYDISDVRRYANKNKVSDLEELIVKAEAALASVRRKEKVMDYLNGEGAEMKEKAEANIKNIRKELMELADYNAEAISETIKSRLTSDNVETNIGLNSFEIGISNGNGRIKDLKRFTIYFSDFGGTTSVELSHSSGRISLIPGETDNEEVELVEIMNEVLHNPSLIGLLIESRNKWKEAEMELWRKESAYEKWLSNPFENKFPE